MGSCERVGDGEADGCACPPPTREGIRPRLFFIFYFRVVGDNKWMDGRLLYWF